MLFNFKTKKIGYEPKWNVAKTIAGFMNAYGGYLLIGYADNGEPKGLRYDFLLRDHGKDPFDYFRLEFDKLLNDYFPKPAQQFIEGRMSKVKGEKTRDIYVFIVQVRPATFPVFVLKTEKDPIENTWFTTKKFVYRKTASTQEITDIEDIATYCRHKWPVQQNL
jgi:predicted HTH transcriptional regulator